MKDNRNFQALVNNMGAAMPTASVITIFVAYIATGWLTGLLVSTLLAAMPGGTALGYLIGIAVAFSRAALVFFKQLNPARPDFSRTGETVAIVFTIAVTAEVYALVGAVALHPTLAISFGILNWLGAIMEIFLIAEVKHHRQTEIAKDPAAREAYIAGRIYAANLEALDDEVTSAIKEHGKFIKKGDFSQFFDSPEQPTDIDQLKMIAIKDAKGEAPDVQAEFYAYAAQIKPGDTEGKIMADLEMIREAFTRGRKGN